MGYIYIAHDITKPNLCKIGLTTGDVHKRISQTENPDYELYCYYPANNQHLREIERGLHLYFGKNFRRLNHASTGKPSEWFECPPSQARELIESRVFDVNTGATTTRSTHKAYNSGGWWEEWNPIIGLLIFFVSFGYILHEPILKILRLIFG